MAFISAVVKYEEVSCVKSGIVWVSLSSGKNKEKKLCNYVCVFSIPVRTSPGRLYRHSPPLGCNPSNVYLVQRTHVEFCVSGSLWNYRSAVKNAEFISALQSLDFLSVTETSPQRALLIQLLSLHVSLVVRPRLVVMVMAQGYSFLLTGHFLFSPSSTCPSPYATCPSPLLPVHLLSLLSISTHTSPSPLTPLHLH